MFNTLNIKIHDIVMGENLNPKMKVRGFKSLFLQLMLFRPLNLD